MPRKAAAAPVADGEEPQARRSTRLASQPKKDEPAPKPAVKRGPSKKRVAEVDDKEGEEKAPAAKKVSSCVCFRVTWGFYALFCGCCAFTDAT